jgi:hypothetical protein
VLESPVTHGVVVKGLVRIDLTSWPSFGTRRISWRQSLFFILLPTLLLGWSVTIRAIVIPVTASWNANPEPDIAGYKLSYGTTSGTYTTTVDVGNVTSYSLPLVSGTTYYFVVQAYNTTGLLSPFSAEMPFTVTGAASPVITNVGPLLGPVGTLTTIVGTGFGLTQGTSTVTFNGTPAVATVWSPLSIVALVPVGATSGGVVVTVGGIASNATTFTVTASTSPNISNLSPVNGPVGTPVTITGTNFGATKGTSTVKFNGTTATPTSWSATSIVVPVPTGATAGNVVVTVGGVASNGVPFAPGTASTVTLVQHANRDAGTTTSSTLAFSAANAAGNFLAVAIRAGQQAQTFTVSDTLGNTYRQAVRFSETVDAATIAIFYAENVAGGSNTVTVADSVTGGSLRFAIFEYSGVATTNSLDVAVTAEGTGTAADSGTATTTANGDLVIGLAALANGATVTAGAGFVVQEQVASPAKLAVEDLRQATAGPIAAAATLSPSDDWGAAVAAFRPAVAAGPPSPVVTSLSPNSGAVGTSITITGTNFGATKGTSTVTFNGTSATPTSWSATSIVVPVPSGATTGNVVVTVGGLASSGVLYTVPGPPSLTSVSPASGPVGTSVTITGANFGATKGTSTVTFNGTSATPTSWSAASIVVPVPSGATTGNIVVTVNSLASAGLPYTVTVAPTLTSVAPTSGPVGTSVTITGANFGSTKSTSTLTFNGTAATPTSWSNTSIVVPVPSGATTGNVVVTVSSLASNGLPYTVAPTSTSLTPTSGPVGTSVTIAGTNFGATKGTSTVTFNGTAATATTWSTTSIVVPVPSGATTGSVVVTVGGMASNSLPYTVTVAPGVTSVSPNSGPVGTSITITGANFGATKGTSTVKFNGTTATPTTWSDTSIVVPVPSGATTGNIVVNVGGLASIGVPYTVTVAPSLTSVTPSSSVVGTSVTIAGSNFGATKGVSTVTFNGTAATPTTWSSNSIVVPVPAAATTGSVVVTVNGLASNGLTYTVLIAPSLTSVAPSSAAIGAAVTIAGANFGATKSTSTVKFNGTAATPTSWSATSIVVPMPTGATSGNVIVTVNGLASNGLPFTVNHAPTLSAVGDRQDESGTTVSLQLSGTDPEGNTLTYGAAGLPASLSVNSSTGLIFGTLASNSAGSYNVVATVSDGSLSDSESFTWRVTQAGRANVAAAANGGTATASSAYSAAYAPSGAIDGDHKGLNWAAGGGWNDATPSQFPDWWQVDFAGAQTIDEIDVFSIQDNAAAPVEPTLGMTFTQWGVTDFLVQSWNGTQWVTVPGGSITDNNQVWRQLLFAPITTSRIRVYVTGALGKASRLAEVEVYTP